MARGARKRPGAGAKDGPRPAPLPGRGRFYACYLLVSLSEKRKGGKEILYECPIYTCPARAAHGTQLKNYISNAELRSEDPVNKWILRAVCLLTTTD